MVLSESPYRKVRGGRIVDFVTITHGGDSPLASRGACGPGRSREGQRRFTRQKAQTRGIRTLLVRVVLARELTKIHEEFLRGTVAEARQELASRDRIRGEITLLVDARPREQGQTAGFVTEKIAERVARLQNESGVDEKEALKRIARELGQSKSDVYRELQRERAKRR